MRFGRNYHQYQVLGWECCYIRYALIKRLIKRTRFQSDDPSRAKCLQELFKCITEDHQFVLEFCRKEAEAIRQVVLHIRALRIRDEEVLINGDMDEMPLAGKDNRIDRLTYDIAAACNRLQWYAKVNSDASIRLRCKFAEIQSPLAQPLLAFLEEPYLTRASMKIRQLVSEVDRFVRSPNDEFSQSLEESSSEVVFCQPIRHSLPSQDWNGHWEGYGRRLPLTHKVLLEAWSQGDPSAFGIGHEPDLPSNAWNLLLIPAVRSGDAGVLEALLWRIDVNFQNTLGETALHVAAREGLPHQLGLLLSASGGRADLDLVERQRGWTPLMLACIHGHARIVEALLSHGAKTNLLDAEGWTAKEHASFRGNLHIAKLFQKVNSSDSPAGVLRGLPLSRPLRLPLLSRPHEHVIFLWLGAANIRSPRNPVEIFDIIRESSKPLTDVEYSLEIRPFDRKVDLPVTDYAINSPWFFATDEPESTLLLFNLRHDNLDKVIGKAVATISTLTHGYHSEGRESLVRDYTIPILEWNDEFVIGTVTFSILVAHPYTQPRLDLCKEVTHRFWKPDGPTQVVGHRGSGANTTAKTNLQLGENTLHSLESAVALGAVGVEFDVQLTKDFIPVIYHNFLVMETGGETVLWNLSRDQFVHLSESQSSKGSVASGAETRYNVRNGQAKARPRSRSLDIYDDDRITDMVERMKHTTEATNKGIKGNMRGMAIQSLFPAFEDLLRKLPESIAFDVELKYPMLWESQDQDWEPFSTEANLFLDTILALIYKYGGRRNITFSSFSPELCILMSLKQKDYPILFINKVGSVPVGDIRASSFQQACAFAKARGLAGIVVLSDPIVMCPRLIGYAKSKGLVCVSYGDLNDVPEFAVRQAEAGLDAIIVNKVRLVRKTLDEWEEKRGEKKEEEVESEEGSSDGEFEDAE